MSEQLRKRWDEFHRNAVKALDRLDEDSEDWFKEFEKVEQTTAGLIMEVNKEIGKSGKEAKKLWKVQLEKAMEVREEARKRLEERMEALRRSEEHLNKALDELK
jgi:mRNA-degrading endonuclease RelE of RelBE toxin-antitoxin system